MRLIVPCLLLLIVGCGPQSVSRNTNMLSLDGKALGSRGGLIKRDYAVFFLLALALICRFIA